MRIKEYYFSLSELRHLFTDSTDLYKIHSLLKTSLVECTEEDNPSTYFDDICSAYGFNFEDLKGTNANQEYSPSNTPVAKLMALITLKYDNHYIAHDNTENKYTSGSIELYNVFKRINLLEFCKGFMSILLTTYSKYNTILNIYDTHMTNIMDGLNRSVSGSKEDDYSTESSGETLHNDTPQDSDIVATIEGNQYVSDLSKSSGKVDNGGTSEYESKETYDTKYQMEKIAEIQDSYQKVLNNWANEFRGIFIEEANL